MTREEADRIYRDAMRYVGTPTIRRALVWAAVSLYSMWKTRKGFSWPRLQLVCAGSALVFGIVVHLLDIVDTGPWEHPWLGDRPLYVEAPIAIGVAVALPLITALVLVPRVTKPASRPDVAAGGKTRKVKVAHEPELLPGLERYKAGSTFGFTFEFVIAPTLLVGAVSALYWVLEHGFKLRSGMGPNIDKNLPIVMVERETAAKKVQASL